jgi:hypothetical protein
MYDVEYVSREAGKICGKQTQVAGGKVDKSRQAGRKRYKGRQTKVF